MTQFQTTPFAELAPNDLYAVLRLRTEVFVMEQNCVFQDMDNWDQRAWHVVGKDAARAVVACARLFAPGVKYAEASIGRIISAPSVRGTGVGRAVVRESLNQCVRLFGAVPVRIAAQSRLERFYGEFGFVRDGADFMEDGIPHCDMTLQA
jgi:ElaA protein